MFEGTGASLPLRQARSRSSQGLSSCDLLLRLAEHRDIVSVFADEGIKTEKLFRVLQELEQQGIPEPADWSHRFRQIGQRQHSMRELEQLLALARSADCNAYRALEQSGVMMPKLRKRILDRMQLQARAGRSRMTGDERMPTETEPHRPSPVESTPIHATHPRLQRVRSSFYNHSSLPSYLREESNDVRGSISSPESPRSSFQESLVEQAESLGHRVGSTAPQSVPHEEQAAQESPAQYSRTKIFPQLSPIDSSQLQELVGRDDVLTLLADACSRKRARAPILVGEHGSGKTLIAQHLSRVLSCPVFLLQAMNYETSDDLSNLFEEVIRQDGVAIIDDLDRIAGDLAPEFLPALIHAWAKGTPSTLTLLSHESHARLADWIPGILDTLDTIMLAPLERQFVGDAVKLSAPTVTQRHNVQLSCNAQLAELTRLADRYLSALAMPGRALDLLDLACARTVRMSQSEVNPAFFVDIVCERTGLPRPQVEGRGEQELLDLGRNLSQRVVGHRHAIDTLTSLIRRNRAGFSSTRPIATALLLGPSGVGKTELAKALAQALFGGGEGSTNHSYDALLRLDMSEFSEPHSVARIVGAPPGYVGHEQGGALSEPMLNRPHCVVLLDEIEKAHRDVHQLLLQVLDEGHLTDGRGRTIDFRHCVLMMTSNLGSEQIMNDDPVSSDNDIFSQVRQAFPIELWNRIEAPLVLRNLNPAELRTICQRMSNLSSQRILKERGIRYKLDDSAFDYILRRAGSDPALGARPIRHILSREVESLVADAILCGQVRAGNLITISEKRGRLGIR